MVALRECSEGIIFQVPEVSAAIEDKALFQVQRCFEGECLRR